MSRKVFFSFHYQRDGVRAGQVRNSNVVKGESIQSSEFIDGVKWEALKRTSDAAVKKWITDQLWGTSVTAILIGAETNGRKWIKYEIEESIRRGNGIVGIYIHNCPLWDHSIDRKGINPLDYHTLIRYGYSQPLSLIYRTYDWVHNDGYRNLGNWIEEAAKIAGK
jgi:hypothetical protein